MAIAVVIFMFARFYQLVHVNCFSVVCVHIVDEGKVIIGKWMEEV